MVKAHRFRGSMSSSSPPGIVVSVAVVSLLMFFVFRGSFGLYRFHDDWTFAMTARYAVLDADVFGYCFSPLEQHWSPLWQATEVVNHVLVGEESDSFIRSVHLLCHALMSGILVAVCVRQLQLSVTAAFGACFVYAAHHTSGVCIYSFDTYSQSVVDLLTAIIFVLSLAELSAPRWWRGWVISGLVVFGLLMKEQGLTGAGVGFVMAVWKIRRCPRHPELTYLMKLRSGWLLLIAMCLLVACFAVTRRLLGVQFAADGPFSLSFPSIPKNIAMFCVALCSPFRTIALKDAYDSRSWMSLCAMLAAVVTVAGAVMHGARKFPDGFASPRLLIVVSCLSMACFPTAMLAHVGELYVHSPLFFFSLLVGIAIEGGVCQARKTVVLAGVLLFVFTSGIGLRENLNEMRTTGDRARQWLSEIESKTRDLPDGAVVLVRPAGPSKNLSDYSLIRLTTPHKLVLTFTRPWALRFVCQDRLFIIWEKNASDVEYARIVRTATINKCLYLLTLEEDQVRADVKDISVPEIQVNSDQVRQF